MKSLSEFLNKKNSTRNLTDQEFEEVLPVLIDELKRFDYSYKYTDQELTRDFNNLRQWTDNSNHIAPQKRAGMKVLEHFMTNFFKVRDWKGRNFEELWQDKEVLEKIWRLNRKSHSTPYISELRRCLYFATGLPKTTMYRPALTKLICDRYRPETVFDPCVGWGGRMLGAVASGARYIGFEPCTETFTNLLRMLMYLEIEEDVALFYDSIENISNHDICEVDMILTSPPYYNLEIYSNESTQSVSSHQTYEEWRDNFLRPMIYNCLSLLSKDGVSCWNVADVNTDRKYPLVKDVTDIHAEMGYTQIDEFGIISSKRMTSNKGGKSTDTTRIYKNV